MADTTFGPKGWTPERLGHQSGKIYIITGAKPTHIVTARRLSSGDVFK